MPNLYIIAGPNGAGKTSVAKTLLPQNLGIIEFVNADNIAAGLSPFSPESVAGDAGRLMLKRINELRDKQVHFAFETTLASRTFANFILTCKQSGYTTHLIYLWLSSVKLAQSRVAFRVEQGGHNIPTETIQRRYERSLHNLKSLYLPLVDYCEIYNATENIQLIAQYESGELVELLEKTTLERIL